jgi:hypothetical protein
MERLESIKVIASEVLVAEPSLRMKVIRVLKVVLRAIRGCMRYADSSLLWNEITMEHCAAGWRKARHTNRHLRKNASAFHLTIIYA